MQRRSSTSPFVNPHRTRWFAALAALLGLTACGGGGGGSTAPGIATPVATPANAVSATTLAVLVADGDADSEAIARAYQLARGIPDANIIRVTLPSRGDAISATDFVRVKAAIDARLTSNMQATLVTWTQPSRVVGSCAMGITSALALGYDTRWCDATGGASGTCATTADSPYYNTATRAPFADLGIRPSMMLGAATLAQAQSLINRGMAADGAQLRTGATAAQAWLVRSSDPLRSVRWPDFQAISNSGVSGMTLHYVDNTNDRNGDVVANQTGVMFYLTGLSTVPQAASNGYLPGAVADTLTSYAGVLPDANGQMPVTAWLTAGATASYGIVEEPCNAVEKFPRASVLLPHYQRGETLIESYWKSVQRPGQGLFVGEPLARPWGS